MRFAQTGLYSYTPNINFTGHDELLLQNYDDNGNMKSLLLNFEVLNIPLTRKYAVDDYVNTRPNTTVSFDLLANDKSPQGIQIVDANIYGGRIASRTNGAIVFVINPEFKGIATVPYIISTPKQSE